jgi:tetratricopeptide (TPR) repeat protein
MGSSSERERLAQEAQGHIEAKRYAEALAVYARLAAEEPADVRTLLRVGDLHVRLSQVREALVAYDAVEKLYVSQGAWSKAAAVVKVMRDLVAKGDAALADEYAALPYRLAEHLLQVPAPAEAMAVLEEHATLLQRAGLERDAIDALKRLASIDPANPVAQVRLGEAYVRVKDLDAALARLDRAAELLHDLGRADDALRVLERGLSLRSEGGRARKAARLLLAKGGAEHARAALARIQVAYQEQRQDRATLELLAEAFDQLGDQAKAFAIRKEMARLARQAGDRAAVQALLPRLLAHAPRDAEVVALQAFASPDAGLGLLADVGAAPPLASPLAPAVAAPVAPALATRRGGASEAPSIEVTGERAAFARGTPPPLTTPPEALLPPVALAPPDPPLASVSEAGGPPSQSRPRARATRTLMHVEDLRNARDLPGAIALLRDGIAEFPEARELREPLFDILLELGDDESAVGEMIAWARHLAGRGRVEEAAQRLDEVLLIDPARAEARDLLVRLGYAEPAPPAHEEPPSSMELELPAPTLLPSPPLDDPFAGAVDAPGTSVGNEVRPVGSPHVLAPVLDEDALEEIEFFASSGMLDDAWAILAEQLLRLPNHPLLRERESELLGLFAARGLPLPPHAPRPPRTATPAPAPAAADDDDRAFAIAAALEGRASATRDVSAESVFAQFKASVAREVSESDSSTHYDLALAYREMGLLSDAIGEFLLAARDPQRECACLSMVGLLRHELGDLDGAIEAWLRGAHAPERTREQEAALTYEVANAYEQQGDLKRAAYFFERLAHLSPAHTDPRGNVRDRVRALRGPSHGSTTRPVQAPIDDFDSSVDEVFRASGGPKRT